MNPKFPGKETQGAVFDVLGSGHFSSAFLAVRLTTLEFYSSYRRAIQDPLRLGDLSHYRERFRAQLRLLRLLEGETREVRIRHAREAAANGWTWNSVLQRGRGRARLQAPQAREAVAA